jgi:putative tryptophan/tyrosine transport system substrate-binding protein
MPLCGSRQTPADTEASSGLSLRIPSSVFTWVRGMREALGLVGRHRGLSASRKKPRCGPLAARAQQTAMPVIGFLSTRSSGDSAYLTDAFRRGLAEGGYVEGQDLTVEYRWVEGRYDRLPAMAMELARRPVAALVAVGGDASAMAARSATATTPIVFVAGTDPVKLGLVASYNRPGGNLTGINILTNTLEPKRLGMLREVLPQSRALGVLVNPNNPPAERQLSDLEAAARAIGLEPQVWRASTDGEIETSFDEASDSGSQRLCLYVNGNQLFPA